MIFRKHFPIAILIVFSGISLYAVLFNTPAKSLALDQYDESIQKADTEASGKSVVHLYFSDMENSFLTAEERVFFHSEELTDFGRVIIEALIDGPRKGLIQTIPPGTTLRALYVTQEGTAYVDLSDKVKDAHPGGVKSELLTIYSIVNSLVLNIPEIDAVKILIEGKGSMTLAGHIDLRFPFKANMLLIR